MNATFLERARHVVVLILLACSPASNDRKNDSAQTSRSDYLPGTPVAVDSVPASVAGIGHHAENAYDMVRSGNWVATQASADSLRTMAASLPATNQVPSAVAELESAITHFNHAVSVRDSSSALRLANKLTEIGANLTRPYNPLVPADVTMLDYYGRELEIWTEAKNNGRLRSAGADIRKTWDGLRARVESKGGIRESGRFEALVIQIDRARSLAEFASLASPVLAEVDSLEAVFTK